MQYYKSQCILFVLFYLTLVAFATDDDWKDIHYKVYATKGLNLQPTETLRLLETLETVYKGRTDEASTSRARRVAKLLSLAKLTESDCDWDHLHVFDDMIRFDAIYFKNVVAYLKHYRREWFSKCSESLESQLKREINRLSGSQRADIALLRQSIVLSDNGLNVANYMSRLDLEHGTLNFIEQKAGPFDPAIVHDDSLGFKEVARRFETHVMRLCESIKTELKPTMKMYATLKDDKIIVKQMDSFLLEWLTDINVCEDILADPSDLCWKAYKTWRKEHPKSGMKLAKKLMGNCFKSKGGCA